MFCPCCFALEGNLDRRRGWGGGANPKHPKKICTKQTSFKKIFQRGPSRTKNPKTSQKHDQYENCSHFWDTFGIVLDFV